MRMLLSFPAINVGVIGLSANWWDEINESVVWQDRIFFILCAAYALVSSVALIQLRRIELRVPEHGWTTQKVFHLMNFIMNGMRAVMFGFHKLVYLLHQKALSLVLLDLPGLLFFSTYTLLVLFWAEIHHQVGSVTAICFASFLVRCFVVVLSAFDVDASLDVLDHPVLNLVYYMLVEILPSALVLYTLRKLPPKRVSAQYHPIH